MAMTHANISVGQIVWWFPLKKGTIGMVERHKVTITTITSAFTVGITYIDETGQEVKTRAHLRNLSPHYPSDDAIFSENE